MFVCVQPVSLYVNSAGESVLFQDKFGKTALQWALNHGNHDCATLLLENGATITDVSVSEVFLYK